MVKQQCFAFHLWSLCTTNIGIYLTIPVEEAAPECNNYEIQQPVKSWWRHQLPVLDPILFHFNSQDTLGRHVSSTQRSALNGYPQFSPVFLCHETLYVRRFFSGYSQRNVEKISNKQCPTPLCLKHLPGLNPSNCKMAFGLYFSLSNKLPISLYSFWHSWSS